jgi:hypothetical protein
MSEITIKFDDEPIEKEQFLRTLHYLSLQKNVKLNLVNCPCEDVKQDFAAFFYFDKENFGLTVYQSPRIVVLHEYFYSEIPKNLEFSFYGKELDKIDQMFFPYLSPIIKEEPRKIVEDKVIKTDLSKEKMLGYLCFYQI